uniref:Angel homolog 2 (Drosophila) n=1 Tax=Callorhinchus milii TaxID=7868 RepID=A0A4W3IEZ6_CALMI
MLTRPLQYLGRSSVVRSEVPQIFFRNAGFLHPQWPPCFQMLNPSIVRSQFCWRTPSTLCGGLWTGPGPVRTAFNPYSMNQSSTFGSPGYPFKPNGNEPQAKRRKCERVNDEPPPTEAGQEQTDCVASHGKGLGNLCVSGELKGQGTISKKVELLNRRWEALTAQKKSGQKRNSKRAASRTQFDFSLMSYNILAQDLLEDNNHLYRHCSWPLLQWEFRFNIFQELKQLDADILCLQEVQSNHYKKQLKPKLEALGYHCEYKMRTGDKRDGCAICFKRSKFSLLSAIPVEFYRPRIPLLDRDNVGLVLLLRPALSSGGAAPNICVANTHLLYNPRRGDIKLAQLAILMAEIGKAASSGKGEYCPIVFCGDLNSVPSSPLYNFIRDGKLLYDGLPIGKVSGQEESSRGQRLLSKPLWPENLGISSACQYEALNYQHINEGSDRPLKAVDSSEVSKDASNEKTSVVKMTSPILQHNFNLTSVYSHYVPESGRAEVTTCHSRSAITVDYIFYSTEEAVHGGLELLGRLTLLTEQDLRTVNCLPNECNSSDHLPLLAKFRLKL